MHTITTKKQRGFTLVEIAAAIILIAMMLTSAMIILDNLTGALSDLRLRRVAFEIAREKMEALLAEKKLQDLLEYGVDEIWPEVQWQKTVEPFYEPVTNQMWIRAVCKTTYTDSKGKSQSVELEHWITNLPPALVKQILDYQKAQQEYLALLNGTASGAQEAFLQESTAAFLAQAGLDVDAYLAFLKSQRQRKLDHLVQYGYDAGYQRLLAQLAAEENEFLARLGMDFDAYNAFAATYVPQVNPLDTTAAPDAATSPTADTKTADTKTPTDNSDQPDKPTDGAKKTGTDSGATDQAGTADSQQQQKRIYTRQDLPPNIPEELVPIFLQLLNSQ